MIDLSPEATTLLLATVGVLFLLLVVSFQSRARVFTQYLHHMTGVRLSPRDVARVYRERGQGGVRDMFLELIIREDLRDGPRITPDTPVDGEPPAGVDPPVEGDPPAGGDGR
jgi:hypothetical protein